MTKGNYEVVVLDLASGVERVLAAAPGEDAYPAWSPDGRHVIFSSDRASTPGRLDLFVMRETGDDVRQVTRGGNDSYAAWAGNGRDVYFVSRREGHGVYRLRLDARQHCLALGLAPLRCARREAATRVKRRPAARILLVRLSIVSSRRIDRTPVAPRSWLLAPPVEFEMRGLHGGAGVSTPGWAFTASPSR